MSIQIKINDDNNTTFTEWERGFTKTYNSIGGYYITFNYKTLGGMLKAAKKIATNASTISHGNGTIKPFK